MIGQLIGTILAIALLAGVYLYGERSGSREVLTDILRDQATSAQEKEQIDDEVKDLSTDDLRDRASQFLRD